MAKEGWDWGAIGPNLSKLPPHLRESLSENIPLRPGEVHGRVLIFRKTPALIHPNGRVLVTKYYKDAARPVGIPDGAQIDLVDFSGREPLVSVLLVKENVPAVLGGLVQSFLAMGGSADDLHAAIDTVAAPPRLPNPLFPEAPDEQ